MHTREKAEIVFKRNGRYDPAGLRKLNQFLRDWRRNEPTKMDPRLFDLIWEAYKQSGARDYIHVVCGYRSPQTNSMLRSRSKGVAKKSQHMLGKAMDFYIPGVKLKKLREIGLKMQGGGVGYYPSLRIALRAFRRRQCPPLAQDEPQGARRAVPRRQDAARAVGRQAASRLQPGARFLPVAQEERQRGGRQPRPELQSSTRSGGLLAAFFGGGGGADDEEDSSTVIVASVDDARSGAADQGGEAGQAAKVDSEPVKADASRSRPEQGGQGRQQDPHPAARARQSRRPAAEPQPETIVAALPARDVPLPLAAPRPQVDVGAVDQIPRPASTQRPLSRAGPAADRRRDRPRRAGGRAQHSAADAAARQCAAAEAANADDGPRP